ncbi:hypothetical protein [Butyrivibrio sp. AE2005]|uniref:hypothetical protein n=1 Tax=Butyrivibrio sp. AE2005 TaxID=1496722 RepID=UPI00047B1312|nr:hypothetical protein [Butyrivibrio sp. AE2005]
MNRSDIRSEIKKLDEQIKEYEAKIFKLEEAYKEVKIHYNNIIKNVYEPQKAYDMSPLSVYGKEIQDGAEKYKERIVTELEKSLSDTSKFLSQIVAIKEKILKEKKECDDRKKALETELDVIS